MPAVLDPGQRADRGAQRSSPAALDVHEGEDEHAMWICRFGADELGGWGLHHHRQHQIVWVARGSTAVQVDDRHWVVPPTQALWIPSGRVHDVRNRPGSLLYCLYIWPDDSPVGWTEPTVLAVTPLVRELLLCLAGEEPETTVSIAGRTMLFELLRPLSHRQHDGSEGHEGFDLPVPDDERAAELARALLACPEDPATLHDWGRLLGASESTLRRAFVAGTGLTFTEWRTQARLRASLAMLHDRVPVDVVARRVGYASTNGYIDAFRRHFGHTPGAHVRAGGPRGH
jgi:AraC-like DNA-binding protein/quercetin dioxygenase-like cupin family protein